MGSSKFRFLEKVRFCGDFFLGSFVTRFAPSVCGVVERAQFRVDSFTVGMLLFSLRLLIVPSIYQVMDRNSTLKMRERLISELIALISSFFSFCFIV